MSACRKLKWVCFKMSMDESMDRFDGDPHGYRGQRGRAMSALVQGVPLSVEVILVKLGVTGASNSATESDIASIDWEGVGRHLENLRRLRLVSISLHSPMAWFSPQWSHRAREQVVHNIGHGMHLQRELPVWGIIHSVTYTNHCDCDLPIC